MQKSMKVLVPTIAVSVAPAAAGWKASVTVPLPAACAGESKRTVTVPCC